MKKVTIVFVFLFTSIFCYAQSTDSIYTLSKYAVGISPSALLNIYNGVQISQDFRIENKINVTLESAYIYGSQLYASRDIDGVRIRGGIEYLVGRFEQHGASIGIFYLKRYIVEKFNFFINYYEQKYRRKLSVRRTKDLSGFGMNFDLREKINKRFRLDFGFGFGLGTISISDKYINSDKKSEDLVFSGWLGYDSHGKYFLPIVLFNINISYALYL